MTGAEQRANTSNNVKLDFSGLFSTENKEKPLHNSTTEPILTGEQYKTITKAEKPTEGQIEGIQSKQEQIPTLAIKAQREQENQQRSLDICSLYQENIKRSGELRTQLLKGVQVGEDIYSLFLKATEAISKMIDNPLFYSQIAEDLKAIYGAGLLQKPPLQMKLQDAQERLQRLIEAEQRDVEPEDKERIQRAIKAHKEEIAQLEATIAR